MKLKDISTPLLIIILLIVFILAFIELRKLRGHLEDGQIDVKVDHSGSTTGPTPGPIIVIEPTDPDPDDSEQANWKIPGHGVVHGECGQIRQDLVGSTVFLKARKKNQTTTVDVTEWEIVVENDKCIPPGAPSPFKHTIRAQNNAGYVTWSINQKPLTACNPADLTITCGLPKELEGQWVKADREFIYGSAQAAQ